MPRPTNKAMLIEQSSANWAKLMQEFEPLSADDITQPGLVGEWSAKDVLAHLLAWQRMCIDWVEAGLRGEDPITPSEKYTWREIPALNQEIYETHQDMPLAEVRAQLEQSHAAALTLIARISDEDLFTPGVYQWTKSTTVGSYLTSATSSHYDWARKEIRKGLKARRAAE